MVDPLVSHWNVLVVAAGVLLVAALVNRFAPLERKRARRTLFLFAMFFVCEVLEVLLAVLGVPAWAVRFAIASSVLEAFTIINLVALVVFDLGLPAIRIHLVSITSDLLVGVAYIVATLAVFRAAGMDPSSVLATSAIVSGVLALSLQATLGNILGGVALQLDGSIHVGDWVQLENGKQGRVKEIRWRHTVLETRDWDQIIVPNASLLASQILILGKREGEMVVQHRMTQFFNVDFRFAPSHVIDTVHGALRESPLEGIAAAPVPVCQLADLAKDGRDSFGVYLVRYWLIDLDRDDAAQSLVRTRVYSALRRAGIPLARPVSTVFLTRSGGADARRSSELRVQRKTALQSLDIFASIPEERQAILAELLHYTPFAKGEIIARAGTRAQFLFILIAGTVEIRTRDREGGARVVATIDAPDFFGEMGLMTGELRAADVVAATNVETYRLDKEAFEKEILAHPAVAAEISKTLAHRRVALLAAREGLDPPSQRLREAREAGEILRRIRGFFGMDK